ncbi:hypothetical protein [Oceanobacillus sp. CFH 90083]|uniref:hypothetical protein n=1 Tax=Oceanobacillus sp. CFH 90083 TaxID=2592336 RepID=UPI00128C0117|nr:hypothetical protein [Oceanobacillus sp. CFH 90083]
MTNRILNLAFYLILVYLVVVALYMAHENKNLSDENDRLQQENAELLIDYHKVSIQRDEAVDAYTQLSNKLMKEDGD